LPLGIGGPPNHFEPPVRHAQSDFVGIRSGDVAGDNKVGDTLARVVEEMFKPAYEFVARIHGALKVAYCCCSRFRLIVSGTAPKQNQLRATIAGSLECLVNIRDGNL
jgi:hypothetical protein